MLFPASAEDVQRLVQNARENKTPLVPVSSGPPHFHGASENPEAETVCFSRMDRIMTIDRKGRYVRVEPGVTFSELIPKMAEAGLRLNLPFLPRPNKSVAASALEREAILIPKYQYDYPDPLLTVEAVFGTGDIFRTGSAAGPGSFEENSSDKILPWGPGSMDYQRLFTGAQGTFGLITWATLKAEIIPTVSRLFLIQSENISTLIDLAYDLTLNRIPDECIILNRRSFACAFSQDQAEEAELSKAKDWVMLCRVCGFDRYPEERLSIYEGYVEDACKKLFLTCERQPAMLPRPMAAYEAMLTDCDRRETYWKLRHGPERELLMLAPPSKAAGIAAHLLARFPEAAVTVQPQVQGRAHRIECDLFLENSGEEAALAAETALFEAARELLPLGAYFDRPYGRLPELVYSEPTATDAIRRLKDIFDPDHILNPGKLCF